MMAHTEGPWEVVGPQDYGVYRIEHLPAENEWVATTTICDIDGDSGREAANAHLIAAAPDLLAALEAVEWVPMEYRESCPWCHADPGSGGHAPDCQRQAAIAKAKGETK
jgi:hypothetical protein